MKENLKDNFIDLTALLLYLLAMLPIYAVIIILMSIYTYLLDVLGGLLIWN